ncbi:antitoxin VapB48 [soil metagenome]
MRDLITSNIMPRTTVDIDSTVLKELKLKAAREGKSLGEVLSEIAAVALRTGPPSHGATFTWRTRPMDAQIDLGDKDALHNALDGQR